ncbi:hypothetical protein SARC_09248 [Sphaeroforma arctica JP610]|uniref:Uncharacterized protein n=1 Tax=Sphaeroforma arctica JP610 TaxID=667725 RepID=A0A0L0FNE2_9EUKA|nr:hypothetical protein SARC_09248 [Sphaeroforma arctica JP610]KNC78312.1 hypothetical protein SARC_09248 [Sphaeroforma arctica JP610]|eukprot:XP_014152214.1 hypothetical protein SARC_09248 [Sphaeroforma arctica JP610]
MAAVDANAPAMQKPKKSLQEILTAAGKRAIGGGVPGAVAMGINVTSLMWLRTTMNYQYRYGTSTTEAFKHLYKEGGIRRFYRGYGPALFQGPLSRFGDTAANAGVLALLDSYDTTSNLPVGVKTIFASAAAATWRVFLMPVDTLKTTMQVEGAKGVSQLRGKLSSGGPKVLYSGAIAASGATFVGHYPWFFVYNLLQEKLPKAEKDETLKKLGRNAVIGFCASVVSDTCSNSIRVVKTTKQTAAVQMSYPETVKMVIKQDGLIGLFGRGLKTRILANAMQGMLFSVLWKALEEQWNKDR